MVDMSAMTPTRVPAIRDTELPGADEDLGLGLDVWEMVGSVEVTTDSDEEVEVLVVKTSVRVVTSVSVEVQFVMTGIATSSDRELPESACCRLGGRKACQLPGRLSYYTLRFV